VQSCRYHPESPAIGICMRCDTLICAACCTRLQGINHCYKCLKSLARSKVRISGNGAAALAALALLGLAWALLFGLMWLAQGQLAP